MGNTYLFIFRVTGNLMGKINVGEVSAISLKPGYLVKVCDLKEV